MGIFFLTIRKISDCETDTQSYCSDLPAGSTGIIIIDKVGI